MNIDRNTKHQLRSTNNTNRGTSNNGENGTNPGMLLMDGLQGRAFNQAQITTIQPSGLNLPQIQTPKTIIMTPSLGAQMQPKLKSISDNASLEVRSLEAQAMLMNQSVTSSFRATNGFQQPQTHQTPKQNYLPQIGNSSPTRKPADVTSEHLNLSGGKTQQFTQMKNQTINLNKSGGTLTKAGVSTRGRSLDNIRNVQFKDEMISNDQYNALMQVVQQKNQLSATINPAQASIFGNYMMKVVQSVERRKKKQQVNQMLAIANNQKLAALVDADYGSSQKQYQRPVNTIALQNFNTQVAEKNSTDVKLKLLSKNTELGGGYTHDLVDRSKNGSVVSQKDYLSSERKATSSLVTSQSDGTMSGMGSSNHKNNQNQYQLAIPSNQNDVVGFKSVFAEPKATEQVAFLLKEAQRKDKIFIPLERAVDTSGLMYKEMKNAPDNHGGIVVFSKQGFVTVGKAKNATSNFISNEQFITDGVNKYILKDIPFFKKFHAMKVFKQWKYIMKWSQYCRKRIQLANNLHLAKPQFSERYHQMIPLLNNIRTLPFIDIKPNVTYGKKQQQLLEDKCTDQLQISKNELNRNLKQVEEYLQNLKDEIQEDDHRYEYSVKERRMMEIIKSSKHGGEDLIVFSKQRKQKEQEEEQFRISKQRHGLYDKFVQFVLKIVCANLIELQYENKRIFKEIFRDQKLGPQFEVSVCFNNAGVLDTDPSMVAHYQSFLNVFTNIEVAIYQNQRVIDFVNDLVALLFVEKPIYYKPIFEHMKKVLSLNTLHSGNNDQIFETLDKDIQRCKDYLEQFMSLQEIYDFANDWELNQRDKQISLEMSFYKETWIEMDKYAAMVEQIPNSNTKMGTILVETASLKKYLAELPKKVIDSIRSNVTNTMETETKSLREELSKTSEILDQLPGSLNVYVEQVNTLKYVKEKQEEFSQKFSTINKLYQLCKQDNIKVGLNLQQAIDEVSHLYETLPKLQKRAQDGLNSNKDTMEKIMHSSSLVLSKKIKAFEKKYVETYLQDRSRIEDCADTLEELFKRSKAIHEIRSKVILYKEFLKLLYEDDANKEQKMEQNKLQCSEDYEFVAEIHKQTIKLWKMLLYWRKRRHMCYNTPFLTLDMNKIIRSINKINRYFEEKLSKNEFMKEKSRPLYKVVMLQVKETSLIIEFLKDLRREALQQRHWLQIFHLIKAPHLKNSTTFTIVNLREYHIQNYRDEIAKIIEHANTELKYERVFKSIKEEWQKHELKVIPYKETMDSYILVNTESLSTSIEENLTTLENVSQSKYASHIKNEIEEQVKMLKLMLKNLEIWVNAQHHWINLDPILQSTSHLAEILKNDSLGIGYGGHEALDEKTTEFLDLRNQFKRIMWSSFKRPSATYNLMIKSRIEVFEKLIKHFTVLQKQVHDYLEARRRAFPRFFFLTDNQFLEFLTLANSNQDFNEYINVMFQGAHKLFINRILGKEPMKDTVQLENYIQTAMLSMDHQVDEQAANIEAQGNMRLAVPLKEVKNGGSLIVSQKGGVSLNTQPIDEDEDLQTEISQSLLSSVHKASILNSKKSLIQSQPHLVQEDSPAPQIQIPVIEEQKPSDTFEVLGMISLNKELFLFEKPVPMINGVESWLVKVEKSMRETIQKQLSYAVTSFPNAPLDEWVLDYPQQVIMTTLHLILSHEINEVFETTSAKKQAPVDMSFNNLNHASNLDLKNTPGGEAADKRNSRDHLGNTDTQRSGALHSGGSSSKVGAPKTKISDQEEEDPAMADYIRRKNELKAQQQAEEDETRKRIAEESKKKFEANELPRDPEKEKRKFIDEMFGQDFPTGSKLLVEELNRGEKSLEGSIMTEKSQLTQSQNKALKLMASKKIDFKEIVMHNLHKKSLQGINLRIHFWINSLIKSLYKQLGGLWEKCLLPTIPLHSMQKVVMKSITSFLVYQRDIVDNLLNKNVTELEDFEWQSQVRLFWTGIEPACQVLCGGWSIYQQNEYLGSLPRLTLTPLTNRYFIFISSALREKSAVLIKTNESTNQVAGDIFEEFSNICMMPYKKVACSPILDLKPLMQTLNGAALASFWLYYENIDKLQMNFLQSLNKEIQMLQQQFIFHELIGGKDLSDTHNVLQRDIVMSSNGARGGTLEHGQISQQHIQDLSKRFDSERDINHQTEKKQSTLNLPKIFKPNSSLGIFATISPASMRSNTIADHMLKSLSSSFRQITLTRFNERVFFISLLKAEGFSNYQLISRLAFDFISNLYTDLEAPPTPIQPTSQVKLTPGSPSPYKYALYTPTHISSHQDSDQNLQTSYHQEDHSATQILSLRDLRLVAKLANLIRDQEQRVYHGTMLELNETTLRESQKLMYAKLKKRDERLKEREQSEKDKELQLIEERRIEVKSIQEGLRLVCRQKLLSLQWVRQYNIIGKVDPSAHMDRIEKKINKSMESNFEKQKIDDDEEAIELMKKSMITASIMSATNAFKVSKGSQIMPGGPLQRKKSISADDVHSRYSSAVGLSELKHNSYKLTENRLFIEQVTKVLKELTDKLNFNKSNAQLRNCVNVLDLFRRSKAIAFVGPVCTGKTSILKIVSNALHVAFKVKLRTSVVNTATMSAKDLYGSIDAFNSHPKITKELKESSEYQTQDDGDFSKSGIFKIILDVFEKERAQTALQDAKDRPKIVQSIFFDSCDIDQPLSESLLDFIERTNRREELKSTATEFMMDFTLAGEIRAPGMFGDERIPITLPNGNVIQFPSDLFLFFETTNLRNASPSFISKVGLIVTEQDDLTWQSIFKRNQNLFMKKQETFFEEQKFKRASVNFRECCEEFLLPFIDKVCTNPRLIAWQPFSPKACTLQLFNILNCVFYKLKDVINQRKLEEDEEFIAELLECEKDVIWSNCLLCVIWSFGAILPRELRRPFEEIFAPFKRRFNLTMSQSATAQAAGARGRFTLFDIYFDPESLQWELLQENIDYKLKLQYDPLHNQLMIPTVEASQCFFLMDILLSVGPRHEENTLDNKHFRALGPSGTGKSFAVNSFLKKVNGDHKFQMIQIPMSAYVTIERIKENIEGLYYCKRRNLLEPKDKERNIILMVDDVHLQTNLKVNILEFLRTWCMSKGYYDMQQGFFKGVGHFTTVTTENSEYRVNEGSKFPGRDPLNSRFLFYTNTIYLDEYDAGGIDRYKAFTQQWFTSKMWNTSKLVNKYYILVTNTVLAFLEKLKRIDAMHYSSILRLNSFHFFNKFCQNFVAYTLTIDEQSFHTPLGKTGEREEDVVSNLMIYEIMRMYGDRLHKSSYRTQLMQKLSESCRQEFIGRAALTQQQIDSLVLGNYHDRLPGACVKYNNIPSSAFPKIKEELKRRYRQCSNNQFLEGFIESPNSVKEIFKISRILFKEQQHLIMVGHSGGGKMEYLQLAAIMNEALVYEINCPRLCESFKFVQNLKKAIISCVGLNKPAFIVISETQLRDPVYIDYLHNFLVNMCNKYETTVLWGDREFTNALIEIERDICLLSSIKRAAEPSDETLLTQAMRKIQKNVHVVLMIDDYQTYFEWVSLFPALEYLCEVMHMDELSTEGYKQFTQGFFTQRGTDNAIFQEAKLMSALVELRQIVKNNLVNTFYSPGMLKYTCTEEFMGISLTEFIFNSEDKMNAYLYGDGNFRLADSMHRQYNYNTPLTITCLYKSRYIMFLELFRYLYDFMGMGLVVRRNYYEAFLRKANEFTDFFRDIKVAKKSLHGQSSQLNVKVAQMRDRVEKLKQLIDEREKTVIRKTKELKDVSLELQMNREEVENALDARDREINDTLHHFEKVTGSEFIFVLSQFSKFTDQEVELLNLVGVLIEKNAKCEGYIKDDHSFYFSDRDELIGLLDERRYFNFDDGCLARFKDFVSLYHHNDFKDKPLFKHLYQYFSGLYKRLNLRNTMANTHSRVKQFAGQIDQIQFALNYSNNYIKDKSQDLDELLSKYDQIFKQEKTMSQKIEEAEISHMRTDHIIESIERYAHKIMSKLTKTKRRIDTLLGDALILASSIVFLGSFAMKERKIIRKEMAEYLNTTTGGFVKCGHYWTEKGGMNNTSLLKAILKEYGVGGNSAEDMILSSLPNGILSQETLIESIFTLMFAPSCPVVIDPTGQLQEFFSKHLLNQNQVKKLFASDQGINGQLEQVIRSTSVFAVLNDMNDCSSNNFGLCQEESLLPRLAHITHNGFEYDPVLLKSPFIQQVLQSQSVHTTHSSVNKRISVIGSGESQPMQSSRDSSNESFSFYQIQVFQPRFDFALNNDYMARATTLIAIDDDEVTTQSSQGMNSAWIDIKEVMLKHFLPDEWSKMKDVKGKIRRLENRRSEINKNFENAFLIANQETLQRLSEYSELKSSVEEIRFYEDEKKLLNEAFQIVLENHALLSSYSNVIYTMFQSLKKLSKITGELTISWKIFMSIVDQILAKTLRELIAKIETQQMGKAHQSSTQIIIDHEGRLAIRSTKQLNNHQTSQVDFTLDEEFFSTQIIPQLFGVLQAGIKTRLSSLYNLIFAIKLAYKKKEVNEQEVEYFFKQLFQLKNFEDWRNLETELVNMDERVEKTKFVAFKREIIKLYPEQGRRLIDIIEKDINQSFQYKQANHTLNFRVFNQSSDFSKLKLFEQINMTFICPDHEFKTKLTQLVYEQLSSVFSFSEEPIKLHQFVKMASWIQPIALIPDCQINTIDTICSVASYFGVSLEILRSSELPQSENSQENSGENAEMKQQIQSQMIDYTAGAHLEYFTKEASVYQRDAYQELDKEDKILTSVFMPKLNVQNLHKKDALRKDEKAIIGGYQNSDPFEVIERAAINGNWVFISTMRFPSYWHKLVALIENLKAKNQVKNTFRLFFDFQFFAQSEIPDSFLFDYSLTFYLSSKSNSNQLNVKEDVWGSILDNNSLLNQLTDYRQVYQDEGLKTTKPILEQNANKLETSPQHPTTPLRQNSSKLINPADNIATQQAEHIKDGQQRDLYNMYMLHNQADGEANARVFKEEMKEQDAFLIQQDLTNSSLDIKSLSMRAKTKMLLGSDAPSELNASIIVGEAEMQQVLQGSIVVAKQEQLIEGPSLLQKSATNRNELDMENDSESLIPASQKSSVHSKKSDNKATSEKYLSEKSLSNFINEKASVKSKEGSEKKADEHQN